MGRVPVGIEVSQYNNEVRARFFDTIWGTQQGWVFLVKIAGKKNLSTFPLHWPAERDRAITLCNLAVVDGDLYLCPQVFSNGERLKQYAVSSQVAWADMDAADPHGLSPAASIILETSPGRWHAYWRFTEPISALDAEDYSHRLAWAFRDLGADQGGWDLTQLLRVPVSYNHKYAGPPTIGEPEYGRDVVPVAELDALEPPPGRITLQQAPVPSPKDLPDPTVVLETYKAMIVPNVRAMIDNEPNTDWSSVLWSLEISLFEIGMDALEVFAVVGTARCNKYERDKRPASDLWRDVMKAQAYVESPDEPVAEWVRDPLLNDVERKEVSQIPDDFIDRYMAWAALRTDAAAEYHLAGALNCLSGILASVVRLPTSAEEYKLNLFQLILADSTTSRKAQPLDAKVLTPFGWAEMGSLHVGDEVIGKDGKPHEVLGISPRTDEEVFRVTFSSGATTECTGDHLWLHKRPGDAAPWALWTLNQLREKPLKHGTQWVRQIPYMKPVQFAFDDFALPIDPYALGMLLGDAGFSQGGIRYTTVDDELLHSLEVAADEVGMEVRQVAKTISYIVGGRRTKKSNPWINALRNLGLFGKRSDTKFVPDNYKLASVDNRLAMLQGLMDTDGYITNKGAAFTSSSSQLVRDVQYLARSLGGWASYREEKPRKISTNVGLPLRMNPFRLKRKAEQYRRRHHRLLSIRSIEPVGMKMVQCIKVDSDDGLYVTDDFIVTHNTTSMKYSIGMLRSVAADAVAATEASAEGLLDELSKRSGISSLFYRDEVSGLLAQFIGKEYLSGMAQTFAHLYDGTDQKRVLRSKTVDVRDPIFSFFGGGVMARVFSICDDSFIVDGFFPRFLFFIGESDSTKLKPLGPPTEEQDSKRYELIEELRKIHDRYDLSMQLRVAGVESNGSRLPWTAKLTEDAWARYNAFETELVAEANQSDTPHLYVPMFARLAVSTLKVAALIASARQDPRDHNGVIIETIDILKALFYAERWRDNAVKVVKNTGKATSERVLDRIVDYLRTRKGGTQKGDVMRRFRLDARQITIILDTLEQRGFITRHKKGKGELLLLTRFAQGVE